MCGQSTAYNIYATLGHTNPLFMDFSGYQNILKEIIQEQKSIPQIQGFPWICGIFLFVRFYEFLSVSNKLETN